jgi:N-acetylneuraminic acid mutarotase
MRPPRIAPLLMLLMLMALGLGACEEKVSEPGIHIYTSDSLRGTIGDTLRFAGTYSGDPSDVARHQWDFNSDGIFDATWVNEGQDWAEVFFSHIYSRADDYTATLQVTTVQNRLYRATTRAIVTDGLPLLSASVPDSVGCGESFSLIGHVTDDAGNRAFWDLRGDGSAELSQTYTDSLTLVLVASFAEPGRYQVDFGASDNDNHVERLSFTIVVGEAPYWTSGADLLEARADHAAAAFDGRLYVFGGRHGRGVVGSTEIYDPFSDTWTPGAPLPTPRWGAKAVAVADRIYVLGGVTQADSIFPSVEIYEPATDSWTVFDPQLPKHRMPSLKRGFAALKVGGTTACCDSIMLFGGMGAAGINDTTLIYATASDSFSMDRTHFMQETRAWLGGATAWNTPAELDGRLYAVGGTADGATPSSRVESYDPFSDFWRLQPAMPSARVAPAVAFLAGKLYVLGGSTTGSGASAVAEVYSLAEEAWDGLPALPLPRSGATALVLPGEERIYLIAGATPATSTYHVEGSRDLQILIPWRCSP